ncbi:hypothetical protein ATCV1_z646L [Acanthocystis turfacea chlorella virus 1]|uniref:Uncharacterized protein z646L n=1 Tax=Chlorovirus heliozoae TaxID=322019 RepID=A7K9Q6_9PHYC|nr:hypothetical protein ATCV1_z646L [Acanthocystis turfacea chlorella virus 1]ABT16780.1 hypothetical protein ATCV1_z646L [Acanthocystis turfacea chlorella virus 1]
MQSPRRSPWRVVVVDYTLLLTYSFCRYTFILTKRTSIYLSSGYRIPDDHIQARCRYSIERRDARGETPHQQGAHREPLVAE